MALYILRRWSWLNMRIMANQKVSRPVGLGFPLHAGRYHVDGFRSWHVTPSCPGDVYFVYESCPMRDQTKLTYSWFRLIRLESEILS